MAHRPGLALALLMTSVLANDHDAAMASDDLALVADLLDARLDLHVTLSSCRAITLVVVLLVAIHDPPPGQVVWGKFHHDPVVREDADVVHTHLAADVSQNLMTVVEFDSEHGIRKGLGDRALELDRTVFLAHILRFRHQSVRFAPDGSARSLGLLCSARLVYAGWSVLPNRGRMGHKPHQAQRF